jgi:SAM-dependent methyltransferase
VKEEQEYPVYGGVHLLFLPHGENIFVAKEVKKKTMDAYTGFAGVYDLFMDNIPYEEWCEYLTGLLKEYGVEDGLVLDLGCGTGKLTRLLADYGYDMIGVDLSEEMLQIAVQKEAEEPRGILYLEQDMREFELYGTVHAVVSICDSMNYLMEYEDLVQVVRLLNQLFCHLIRSCLRMHGVGIHGILMIHLCLLLCFEKTHNPARSETVCPEFKEFFCILKA